MKNCLKIPKQILFYSRKEGSNFEDFSCHWSSSRRWKCTPMLTKSSCSANSTKRGVASSFAAIACHLRIRRCQTATLDQLDYAWSCCYIINAHQRHTLSFSLFLFLSFSLSSFLSFSLSRPRSRRQRCRTGGSTEHLSSSLSKRQVSFQVSDTCLKAD